jgi:hypothetical protein
MEENQSHRGYDPDAYSNERTSGEQVTREECHQIREQMRKKSISQVDEDLPWSIPTLYRHANGDCQHWLPEQNPRSVNWDRLKPCIRHKDELSDPRRVTLEVEGFAHSEMTVTHRDDYRMLQMILQAAEKQDLDESFPHRREGRSDGDQRR